MSARRPLSSSDRAAHRPHVTGRADVALAVRGNTGGHRLEIRFSGADNTKFFFREPDDIQRTRELTVPSSVFRWP